MRVISGKYARLNLKTLEGISLRPTSDMVKESLFNILGPINNFSCLDLFAGSGAIGIECISRGCEYVVFNDNSSSSINILKQNINMLKDNSTKFEFTKMDALTYLKQCKTKFNFIYVDPPYASNEYKLIHNLINANELLLENGVVVYEMDRNNRQLDELNMKTYNYGKTKLLIYHKSDIIV
jgi:16S rRNA (guanine(966)-N(2))-methyltransferase RsmD